MLSRNGDTTTSIEDLGNTSHIDENYLASLKILSVLYKCNLHVHVMHVAHILPYSTWKLKGVYELYRIHFVWA